MYKSVICGVVVFVSALVCFTACGWERNRMNAVKDEGEENNQVEQYFFPAETDKHEGTWIIWPHHYTYGKEYREEIEHIWLDMTAALYPGENVHIVAYDEKEKKRIGNLLEAENIDISRVDFLIARSDDVWARDTGPIFVLDKNGMRSIADFAFDGWGRKTAYKNDDNLSSEVAAENGFPILSISDFVLEGGSVEVDGKGTAMLCKSSVVSRNRNPDMSISEAEEYLRQYLGVENFIWLEGVVDEDITDAHIDGMARFHSEETILTVSEEDFLDLYENILPEDYDMLYSARNAKGQPYEIITLPMTAKNVEGLDYKGSYLNFYVGNEVVLMPAYGDVNDGTAMEMLSELYSGRSVVPIDVRALYKYGGMLHCITQQQP